MEPKKEKGNLYFYLVVFGILIGTLVGLSFTEGGRMAFGEILDIESLMAPLVVMIVIFVGGLFVAWRLSKKQHPEAPCCPMCGQELPEDQIEDQKSITSPEKS